jgi:hypothetical protein
VSSQAAVFPGVGIAVAVALRAEVAVEGGIVSNRPTSVERRVERKKAIRIKKRTFI